MPRAGLTSRSVAEEAARIADEQGFDRLSLSAVAKRCGVAVPSLYKHVRGLDGLRREVALLAVHEFGDLLGRAAMGRSGADAIRAVADAYRDYAKTRPGRYAAFQRAPDPGDHEAVAASAVSVEVLAAVLREFDLPREHAVHTIRALRSALHGFVDLEARGGFGLPEDVDESYSILVEGFIGALRNRPTATGGEAV